MAFAFPAEYSWNLMVAVLMCFHCFIVGGGVGSVRRELFTKQFFDQYFPELKGNFPKGGYPDMGNGKFSQKLTLDQWTRFNNAQRVHYNYLEGLTLVVVLELVAGLYFPRYAALLGCLYIVGRVVYTFLYKTKGPGARSAGAALFDVALIGLFGMSLYGTFQSGGGVEGLKALFAF